jgi:hypothetical protein
MKLALTPIQRLRIARSEAAKAAVEKALSGEPVADELARLKEYQELIALSETRLSGSVIAAILVGAACLLMAGLAWTTPIPNTKIHMTVTTESLRIGLADRWAWNGNWQLQPASFRLDEFGQIALPPEFSPPAKLEGRAWLDVESGQVTLSALDVGRDATLVIARDAPSITHLLSRNASLQGQAQISGTVKLSAGDTLFRPTVDKSSSIEIPAALSFYDAGRPNIPARIRISPKEKVVWRNIVVDDLSFSREIDSPTERSGFESGVESGTVTIGDTREKFELKSKEHLHLESVSGVIRELEIGPDALRISFEGRAKRISTGLTGFEDKRTPTWLSYIYHQERLSFLWGAIAFLWGTLWSARQLLFK